MKQTELLASVPLNEGVFELLRETTPALAYDDMSGSSALRARIRIGSKMTPIDSLGTLVRWATTHRLHLPTKVAKAPAVFAQVTGSAST
jgi:hypothetical protein